MSIYATIKIIYPYRAKVVFLNRSWTLLLGTLGTVMIIQANSVDVLIAAGYLFLIWSMITTANTEIPAYLGELSIC